MLLTDRDAGRAEQIRSRGLLAVVDRSIAPFNGCIVLALIEGEFTIKRYYRVDDRIVLRAENPLFPNIEISE